MNSCSVCKPAAICLCQGIAALIEVKCTGYICPKWVSASRQQFSKLDLGKEE